MVMVHCGGRAVALVLATITLRTAETGACPFLLNKLGEGEQYLALGGAPHQGLHTRRLLDECNSAFCYVRLVPDSIVPPFNASFSDLVEFGTPNSNASLFNYMEDSQARRDELSGFPLNNGDPEKGAAGYTYLGQFLSHDINLDENSILGVKVNANSLPNSNTPFLDLETLYNFKGTPAKFENGRFAIGLTNSTNPLYRDFPRDEFGKAEIPDLRNDEHRIVAQIAVAFMVLHNTFYDNDICDSNSDSDSDSNSDSDSDSNSDSDSGSDDGGEDRMLDDENDRFKCARIQTTKAWQSVVLTDLLPNLLDVEVLDEVLDESERKLYVGEVKDKVLMPVEFSTGAFRLFHSRARGRYRLNNDTDNSQGNKLARLFDVGNPEPNLVGGSQLTDLFVIEWDRFFGPTATLSGGNVARIMDMLYSRPIMRLPIGEAGTPEEIISIACTASECPITVNETTVGTEVVAPLAVLDLVRAQTQQLPGGIEMANYVKTSLGVNDITVYSLEDMMNNVFGLPAEYDYDDVPLPIYLAHESILERNGTVLGKLGSRIVAETLYGLVEESPVSILDDGEFTYSSPITNSHVVEMQDVFEYIGWL